MPDPNAFAGVVDRVWPPLEEVTAAPEPPSFIEISFRDGPSGLLDMTDPRSTVWARVLDESGRDNEPSYVQIDPTSRHIINVLTPLQVTIGAITPAAADDVEVELIISHARHYLRRGRPDFSELYQRLRTAAESAQPVLVTETLDTHEIIDVRPNPRGQAPALESSPIGSPLMAPVSLQQAYRMFSLSAGTTCCPSTAAAPCIPFQFPDDGCWGRAHEMVRLMIGAGVQPAKVWIYGNLRTQTQNNPTCHVDWGWHVAPTLQIHSGGSPGTYVIDPSLFTTPVPQATWASVQGDPHASLVPTDASVFHRSFGGTLTYDPTYSQTRAVLSTYRRQLVLRSTGSNGPPPYLQCVAPRPGVQWFGTIEGGATRRWFTFGWPAEWHVFWTIMPITPCPGAPQLKWRVQVERANARQATYWISVTNLTSSTVRFEGRYDVLSRAAVLAQPAKRAERELTVQPGLALERLAPVANGFAPLTAH